MTCDTRPAVTDGASMPPGRDRRPTLPTPTFWALGDGTRELNATKEAMHKDAHPAIGRAHR